MPSRPYRTAPEPIASIPPGIPFIIGNEAAERFSFYGMRALLITFMTAFLVTPSGQPDYMTEEEAKSWFHQFVAAVYFTPLLGALLADLCFGKYRTIIWLSLVYCAGHLVLAVDDTRRGLLLGLGLIALGAGGIKPCVSAHVGDQFGKTNAHWLEQVYGWFYISINVGAFASTLATPWLMNEFPIWLKEYAPRLAPQDPQALRQLGPHVAFAVPGLLMLLATLIFWMGRHRFVHVPAKGTGALRAALGGQGRRALVRLVPLYLFVSVFWSLYDQSASAWVLQAGQMDRRFLGINWYSEQIQAINPSLILVMAPLFTYVVYPGAERVVRCTALRKVSAGFLLTVVAFGISAYAQELVDRGMKPSIGWQLAAFVVLTAAEVMVSITCLEFSYTQAPRELKSFVMGLYYLSVSLGNYLTAAVNWFIQNEDKSSKLPGASYYWFFTGLMGVSAVAFVPLAARFREQTYLQDEEPVAGNA